MITASILPILYPFFSIISTTSERSTLESISLYASSVSGKNLPISPSASAPSIASAIVCSSTSASECPLRPMSCGMSMPPMMSGLPHSKAWTSKPCPILNMMIHHSFYNCFRHDQILHGSDFYIVVIRCDNMDFLAQRFHHARIIRHTQIILCRFTVGPHDEAIAKCLWSMRHDKFVPGDGLFDFAVVNPLDGVFHIHTADYRRFMLHVLIQFRRYIL